MNKTQSAPALEKLLADQNTHIILTGLCGCAPACFLSNSLENLNRPVLWITEDQAQADRVETDLAFFSSLRVIAFPCHDGPPFVPLLPSHDLMAKRIAALYELGTGEGNPVVVAPVQALLEYTIPADLLMNCVEFIQSGEDLDLESLSDWLIRAGYEHTALVQARGQYSLRGGLIDIFPPGLDLPVRVDLFGETVEHIRRFDPLTQKSSGALEELVLLPAQELLYFEPWGRDAQARVVERAGAYGWSASRLNRLLQQIEQKRVLEFQRALIGLFYPEMPALTDYLSSSTLVILHDPISIQRSLDVLAKKMKDLYQTAMQQERILAPLEGYIRPHEDLARQLEAHGCLSIDLMRLTEQDMGIFKSRSPGKKTEVLEISTHPPDLPAPSVRGKGTVLLKPAMDRIQRWLEEGFQIVLPVTGPRHALRMAELMKMHQIIPEEVVPQVENPPFTWSGPEPGLKLVEGQVSAGFVSPSQRLVVLPEDEILGTRFRPPAKKRPEVQRDILGFEDLKPGQAVVHRDHGIGLYQGLVRLKTQGTAGEFLLLEYRGGDKLYLPVDRLALIQRYVGVEGREPRLDRLGGTSWYSRKQKIKKSIYEIAHELVDLYAARKIREGHAFSESGIMFRQFEAGFPYEETPDQDTAIQETISDMQAPGPMDRLLCGDVGFGKTEVAMRAAFKAVEDNRQVAVLVPTTLLAEQHERTFRQRFRRFPVTVASLSRLKTRKEQRSILDAAARGEIDILIGTHRLLQSDVRFKDLGLLIVDEEHRFGVKHKEQLKRLKQTVDCLALTATPIPRTLQLSLLGVRDLSTINTPPQARLPIKTYLAEWDDSLVRQAMEREITRGGQVFFIHNRVKGIHALAEHLKRLVPEAKMEVAHGQMSPAELEDIMIRFVRGDIDCLICTTIVESGLDIPSANTIIINRADRLGLADLYQLRGRVGRAGEQAHAYLLVPDLTRIPDQARRRLKAITEMGNAVGGGFRLAMHDLQIRGAGNILGVSQSGQIAEVGYEMYLDLLQKAVEELKGQPVKDYMDPEINLGVPAFLPESYVPDMELRLGLYRRLSRSESREEAEDLAVEMRDRFGPLPMETQNLFELIEIKRLLRALNITRLDASRGPGPRKLVMAFGSEGPPCIEGILNLIKTKKTWRLLPDQRLVVDMRPGSDEGGSIRYLQNVQKSLQPLLKMVNGTH